MQWFYSLLLHKGRQYFYRQLTLCTILTAHTRKYATLFAILALNFNGQPKSMPNSFGNALHCGMQLVLSRLNEESAYFHVPTPPLSPLFVSIANKLISRKINVSMRVEATFCLAAY